MFKKKMIINCAIALLVASLCVALSDKPVLKRLELIGYDILFNLQKFPQESSRKVVFVEIRNSDIREYVEPWSKANVAKLCSILKYFGAEQVYLDMLFAKLSEVDDQVLVESFRDVDNVYMPYSLKLPERIIDESDAPLKHITATLKGKGFDNIYSDIDGKVRRIPLLYEKDSMCHKNIILQMTMDLLDVDIKKITPDQIELSGNRGTIKIPIENNNMLLSWYGKWYSAFTHYNFSQIVHAYEDVQNKRPPKIDISVIRDSVCLVASTTTGMNDVRGTPLEREYPSLGIAGTALSNILQQKFLTFLPPWINIVLVYLFAMMPAIFVSSEKLSRPLMGIIIVVLISIFPILFLKRIVANAALPIVAFLLSFVIATLYDMAKSKFEKNILTTLSNTDDLTGLTNIRHFREILKQECKDAKEDRRKKFCIVLCDIDKFKSINDTHGHQVGDFVISNIGKVINCSIRSHDILARYGGDELILFFRQIDLEGAYSISEKIRANIENFSLNYQDDTYKVTLSMGVASFNPQVDDEESIVKRADEALYESKQKGRNCVTAKKLE
ncbi:MAG: hypothetical protein A2Y03_01525 [Omnitrophica WOR_2 bacterium GWF2_38_59]|nr:MAG: hypothetical protein A2Y03_01525 [Omnitrophica WOR_2 bacterium GWF2_38_59]OGX46637.1 MAG: hypothetical protein A2243_04125 [Omnitrophica WOR_2 bacterium RIFOXYA2_FULL_38_17]OGX54468.1 MAG: hypothetical protein A2267_07205 [Omnitrophica WOR_2 bacterium RIFOXYA12_FULL_38_10]OGX55553.1 MAG: hypothetical protein A2447_05270 [Omnitrophica WOR_2 bacterium RIFOXYC2_FULL_38_12]OGX59414.1 MAG: hypothetical protein A2306_04050 [Omnitrophica WOR_2 bacterium RIFOXYB2_FULL_38_16]HBG61261.1 hypothet